MAQHNDRWLRIISPLVLIIIALYESRALIPPYSTRKLAFAIYTVVCFGVSFEVSRYIIIRVRRKYPFLEHTRKRLNIALLSVITAVFAIKVVTYAGYSSISGKYSFPVDIVIGLVLETLLVTLICIGLYEALYFYTRFLHAEKEKESLLRANLQSQLDSLRTQVNPHFLFNSLNSLTALIGKDCDRAEEFVEEMSSVYRYLLRNNIDDLTTLKEELQFIRSYLHMQETRFGHGLQYEIDVAEEYTSLLLPPLTLQMLVENAIKHNVISMSSPLRIIITTNNADRLVISNNLQKKHRRVFSGKVGLANIISKYKLLNAEEIEIEENGKAFIVTIPLIRNYAFESSNH